MDFNFKPSGLKKKTGTADPVGMVAIYLVSIFSPASMLSPGGLTLTFDPQVFPKKLSLGKIFWGKPVPCLLFMAPKKAPIVSALTIFSVSLIFLPLTLRGMSHGSGRILSPGNQSRRPPGIPLHGEGGDPVLAARHGGVFVLRSVFTGLVLSVILGLFSISVPNGFPVSFPRAGVGVSCVGRVSPKGVTRHSSTDSIHFRVPLR